MTFVGLRKRDLVRPKSRAFSSDTTVSCASVTKGRRMVAANSRIVKSEIVNAFTRTFVGGKFAQRFSAVGCLQAGMR